MPTDDMEKTEAPTPRRRTEARESGNVARSQDLTAAGTLLGAIVLLHVLGLRMLGSMKMSVETMLSMAHVANPTRPDDLALLAGITGRLLLISVGPLLLAIGAVGLAITAAQVGVLVTLKPLAPSFEKISPLKGLRNLFNAKAGGRVVMSVLKVSVIAAVAGLLIYQDLPSLMHIGRAGVAAGFRAACALVYGLGLKLAALLIVLGVMDYAFQRWKHEQDLKMSKQAVKEEMKRMEGDPMVKQRRGRVARQLAMQRTAASVPNADVVVTNPTHFAVALQYDAASMHAPKVLAKGADFMAMRMRQLAAAHGVPIVERKPLARALYSGVEVGGEVPPEHYAAVAEILAYVYQLGEHQSAA